MLTINIEPSARLQNIEATERAKRLLSENQQSGKKDNGQSEYNAPSRCKFKKAKGGGRLEYRMLTFTNFSQFRYQNRSEKTISLGVISDKQQQTML